MKARGPDDLVVRGILFVLRLFLPKRDAEMIIGDLAEEHALRKDLRWLMGQILR